MKRMSNKYTFDISGLEYKVEIFNELKLLTITLLNPRRHVKSIPLDYNVATCIERLMEKINDDEATKNN